MNKQHVITNDLNGTQTLERLVVNTETASQLSRLTADQLTQMRPTLLIFLGGSGQLMATFLKALLERRFGDSWRQKIRLLVFDTAAEPITASVGDQMVRLEAGSEFFHIGEVPIPNIRRNVANLESIQERLGAVLHKLPAGAMRGNGAKSIRPLALMAFYWHFDTIYQQVRQAIWHLAGRNLNSVEAARQQQGINVFIGFSVAGATGSGTFLDMANLARHLTNELGDQGQFCHITGVCILPQAFQSIPATNLYANSAASLEEMNCLMVHGGFKARYPGNRLVNVPESPFNLLYVVDGLDEQGQTWSGIQDVARMGAEGILLQMVSQLGRKGDNAFDNVDEILIGRTAEGQGTFLASFGLGYLEFPAPDVADLCAHWLLLDLINRHWLAPNSVDEATAQQTAVRRLQIITSEQLNGKLLHQAKTGGELRLDLRQPGWLADKPHDQVAAEATSYAREYGLSRVNEELLPQLAQNAATIAVGQREDWTDWINGHLFAPETTLPQTIATLRQAQRVLENWLNGSQPPLLEIEKTVTHAATNMNQAEAALREAANSFAFGRAGRIREGLDRYFKMTGELYAAQLRQEQLRGQRRVWSELSEHLAGLERTAQMLVGRLESIEHQTRGNADRLLRAAQKGGIARHSLADEAYIRRLYAACAPEQVNLATTLPDQGMSGAPLLLAQLETNQLSTLLRKSLAPFFVSIENMTIEKVIADRSAEMTPRARRQQLFLLATPSWSIDRARLPEGGANLTRIEVMGVSDAADTLFAAEGTLVSTYDPYRLVALVVVAGAPPSSLQQYDRYRQSLEQIRAFRPMYVLPQFMADAGQARLAFALGHIFEFIFNQGAYFYYQSGDELAAPLRLGNGLANAIQYLEGNEGLVREIMERSDSRIARLGLQQAIGILTNYYHATPDGRTPLDDLVRELKRLVRDYTEDLHQIDALNSGARR